MAKLGILASIASIVAALGFATMSSAAGDKDKCVHTEFKTEIAKTACTGPGGSQAAAKKAMQDFMKKAKIKSCNQCHKNLAPKYDLKDDAFEQFKKAGGKMVDGAK